MSINLKKATLSDIPTLITLERSVAGTNIYSPMLEADEWKEALQKGEVCLIEKDHVIAGNVSYEIKNKDHIYISGLVVDPRFQGRGIAKTALTQVLKKLQDTRRIDLVTHPDNTKALALYQSLGFIIESRKENYYGDGEPRLVLVLQK